MATKRTSTATKHPPQEDVEDDLSIEYPSSDGEPMAESEFQYIPLTDTVAALRHWFIHRTDAYIAGDMLVPFPLEYALCRISVNHSRASRNPELEAAFQYQ